MTSVFTLRYSYTIVHCNSDECVCDPTNNLNTGWTGRTVIQKGISIGLVRFMKDRTSQK